MSQLICPKCSKDYVKRVGRQGLKEHVLSLCYVYPFRCQLCGYRFRFLQWGIRYQRVEEDRREYERLPMNFPVSFEGDDVRGVGSVVDISMSGCSLHAEAQLEEGKILQMVLQISRDLLPVAVEAAIVRTVQANRVGVEFLRFQPTERERLQLFVRGLVLGRKT